MASPCTKPAIFLDRDGTLIEDCGHLRAAREVAFLGQALPALRMLRHEFDLFIVTNQSGIAEGAISPVEAAQVHEHILRFFAQAGIQIKQVYCCPHRRSDGCGCIKPKPYFLQEASRRHGIDLRNSFVIGDHPHDVELAMNAGATGVYVLTGHGAKHRHELPADTLVTSNLWEAAVAAMDVFRSRQRSRGQGTEVVQAADVIRKGGVVAFPTETVYGLGANAFNARAVARVFEIKNRPRFDPLIVHVADFGQSESLVQYFPETARALAWNFWPGPLTLVLHKNPIVPDIVTAGLPTVALRMPDHPTALALIREAGVPLAAPSANPFGRISPTTADHVRAQLGRQVDMVMDGGPCPIGVESSVVACEDGRFSILRPGGLPVEEVERIVGPVCRMRHHDHPLCPGQLPRHYAPRTPLVLHQNGAPAPSGARAGLLAFRSADVGCGFAAVEVLSPNGDLREAATGLFSALHRLDRLGLDMIVAETVPETGLGAAINDRLRRAAHRAALDTPGGQA